jgi:hypothetical protein
MFLVHTRVASDLGDTVMLTLLAPVMQTAFAMRGGVLLWPWGLFSVGKLAWVVFDASSEVLASSHIQTVFARVGTESFRVVATGCAFAAGLAQHFALVQARQALVATPEVASPDGQDV